ncbi:MAG: ABC transporter substrate-binding protein [Trebonia sp.]
MTRHLNLTSLGSAAACLVVVGGLAACGSSGGSAGGNSSGGGTQSVSSGGSSSGNSNLTKITIAGSTGGGILPATVAEEQGFFKQRGLDATIVYATNPTNLMTGLGHQYQIVESYAPNLINAVAQGIPAVGVAGGEIDTPQVPITDAAVPADSSIKSFADLSGKRIGAPSVNGSIAVCNLAAIAKAGGKPASVTLTQVPFADEASQASSGRIDAFLSATPYMATQAPKYRDVGDCFRSINQDMFTLWISSNPWATQNKTALANFRAALTQAATWIHSHHAGAIKAFSKESGISPSLLNKAPIPSFNATLTNNDVVPWIAMMKDVGMFHGTIKDPNSLVQS